MYNKLKKTLWEGVKYTGCMSFEMLIELINVSMVSFYGIDYIAAIGIFNSMFHVLEYSFIYGFNGAIQTFTAQSIGKGHTDLC